MNKPWNADSDEKPNESIVEKDTETQTDYCWISCNKIEIYYKS